MGVKSLIYCEDCKVYSEVGDITEVKDAAYLALRGKLFYPHEPWLSILRKTGLLLSLDAISAFKRRHEGHRVRLTNLLNVDMEWFKTYKQVQDSRYEVK